MSGYGVSTAEKNPAKLALAIQSLYAGRSNATGSVTLTPNATSTTVNAPNCAPQSAVQLGAPRTANAAAAVSTTYISAVGQQSFTITHANAATTDRTFFYACFG